MPLKDTTKIMPHQKAAEDKAIANDGQILLTHSMGTGKTLSSINIADRLVREGKAKKTLVVVPASLRTNFVENGVKKYTKDKATMFGSLTESHSHIDDASIPDTPYYVVSYDMFRKDPHKYVSRTKADTLIVDEMHNFRNPDTVNYQQMKSVRGRVRNFIGLTGTPLNNHPYDTVPLIDIVSNGNHGLGRNKKEFSQRFIRKVPELDMHGKNTGELVESIVNKDRLKGELNKYVHHATSDDLGSNDMPDKVVQNVDVEMSPLQVDHYKFVMNKIPKHVRDQIRDGMPVNRKEAFHILPMLQQARNVMNGIHYLNKDISLEDSAEKTPKIKKALDDIQQHIAETPDAQIIVHSHMLEGGTDVISAGLKARGISHGMFTGKVDHELRDKAVSDYNSGKNKVIVISSAGTTGLNLPNTTMHVALDPHFNPAVIDQIEARGVRAGGLHHRRPEDRKVIIKRYRSVHPDKWYHKMGIGRKDMSVDEWMYGLASNKQDLNNQVDDILKKTASFLDKYAVSIDARRNKQYWQLMKRMYGGTENAVSNLTKTHDFGIYHGTRESNIPSIANSGLNQQRYREFGKGTFFGDKDTASLYSKPQFISKDMGYPLGNFQGSTLEEAHAFAKENPHLAEDYPMSKGSLLRLKKPSELKGTKTVYPNVNDAMVFDLKSRGLDDAAEAPFAYLGHSNRRFGWNSTRDRYMTLVGRQLRSLPVNKLEERANALAPSLKEKATKLIENTRHFPSDAARPLADLIFKDRYMPRTSKEINKAMYYGEVKGKRLFEHVTEGSGRHEFFFNKTDVPANLLTGDDLKAELAKKVETSIPKINEPIVNKPLLNEPKVDVPKVNEPKVDVPKVNEPKVDTTETSTTSKIKPWRVGAAVAGTTVVGGLAYSKYLSGKKNDTDKVASEEAVHNKLLKDVAGEHAAINLYQKHISNLSEGKVKDKLEEIRDEEKVHVKELTELLKSASCINESYKAFCFRYNIH